MIGIRDQSEPFWEQDKKLQSLKVGYALIQEGIETGSITLKNRGQRMLKCGNSYPSKSGVYKNRCRDRICPRCTMYKNRYDYRKLESALSEIDLDKYRPVLITLTVPNCSLENIKKCLKDINASFTRFCNYASVKNAIVGFYRTTELVPAKELGMYNPHIHAMFLMEENYYDTQNGLFMDLEKWRAEWGRKWSKALKTSEWREIDIKVLKYKNNSEGTATLEESVDRVTKYIVKPLEIFKSTDIKRLIEIGKQIGNVRFQSAGGIIKKRIRSQKEEWQKRIRDWKATKN